MIICPSKINLFVCLSSITVDTSGNMIFIRPNAEALRIALNCVLNIGRFWRQYRMLRQPRNGFRSGSSDCSWVYLSAPRSSVRMVSVRPRGRSPDHAQGFSERSQKSADASWPGALFLFARFHLARSLPGALPRPSYRAGAYDQSLQLVASATRIGNAFPPLSREESS